MFYFCREFRPSVIKSLLEVSPLQAVSSRVIFVYNTTEGVSQEINESKSKKDLLILPT